MTDLILAIVHHLLVFGLVAMLAIERVLAGAPVVDIPRLARLDGGYGGTATLIVLVGIGRVIRGGKGWAFYQSNPFFWAKIATFLLIGLISIGPTMAFLRWARAARAEAGFQPPIADRKRVITALNLQALLLVVLLASAAAMARYPF